MTLVAVVLLSHVTDFLCVTAEAIYSPVKQGDGANGPVMLWKCVAWRE